MSCIAGKGLLLDVLEAKSMPAHGEYRSKQKGTIAKLFIFAVPLIR
jgi:hypothetical protein